MSLRPKSPLAMLSLLLILSLTASGCAFLSDAIGLGPLKPKVHLEKVEIRRVTMTSLELQLSIKVDNPNDKELELSNIKYEVEALGNIVAEGKHRKKIKIAPEGPTVVKLPVSISAKHALTLIKAVLGGQREVIANVKAVADFTTPFGPIEVDFEEKKSLVKFGN